MPKGLLIDQAKPQDIEALLTVLAEGREALGLLGIDQWQDGYPTRTLIADDLRRAISYKAMDLATGRIVGTVAIDFAGEKTYDIIDGAWLTDSTSKTARYGVVHRIAVRAQARRRGVARELIEKALALGRARGAESLRIDTHPGNVPMQRFIESCGFDYCGIIQIDLARETTKERLAYERLI